MKTKTKSNDKDWGYGAMILTSMFILLSIGVNVISRMPIVFGYYFAMLGTVGILVMLIFPYLKMKKT